MKRNCAESSSSGLRERRRSRGDPHLITSPFQPRAKRRRSLPFLSFSFLRAHRISDAFPSLARRSEEEDCLSGGTCREEDRKEERHASVFAPHHFVDGEKREIKANERGGKETVSYAREVKDEERRGDCLRSRRRQQHCTLGLPLLFPFPLSPLATNTDNSSSSLLPSVSPFFYCTFGSITPNGVPPLPSFLETLPPSALCYSRILPFFEAAVFLLRE